MCDSAFAHVIHIFSYLFIQGKAKDVFVLPIIAVLIDRVFSPQSENPSLPDSMAHLLE